MKLQNAVDFYSEKTIQKKDGKKPLIEYVGGSYSQAGESGILEEIFNRIETENKYYVEFGAGDGYSLSNTAHFRVNKGWDGLLLEADENKIPKNEADSLNLKKELITSDNINEIFKKYNVPNNFGILSIDIDGDDAYVFESLNMNIFKPDVIIIEFNPGLPNHKRIKVKEQKGNLSNGNLHARGYIGANICELYEIAKSKGYEFVTTHSVNAFFIKKEFFYLLEIEKLTREEIMSIHTYWAGYDLWKPDILNSNDEWVVE